MPGMGEKESSVYWGGVPVTSELKLENVVSEPLRRRLYTGAEPGRMPHPGSVPDDIIERTEFVSSEVDNVLLESKILSIISSFKG